MYRPDRALILLVSGLLAIVALRFEPLQADGPITEAAVLGVEQQLVCPTCSNLRLDFCDLAICNDMRGVIRQQLAEGRSQDEVVDYFVARYGDRVLVVPPKSGVPLVAWALPAGAGVLAIAGAALMLRRRRTPAATVVAGVGDPRIAEELRRFGDENAPWS